MLSVDAALKGLAALVGLTFGLILLLGGSRRSADRWLALFFFLIAGNHAAETGRALAGDPEVAFRWFQLATVFAAADPLALYLFTANHPEPNGLRRPRYVVPLAATAAALAAWALLLPGFPGDLGPLPVVLGVFTFVVYGVLLSSLVKALWERPHDPAPRALVPAMMVVAFHVAMARGEDLTAGAAFLIEGVLTRDGWTAMVIGGVVVLAILVAAVLLIARRAPPHARPVLLLGLAVAAPVMVIIRSYNFLVVLGDVNGFSVDTSLAALGRSGAAIRWLLFGAFVSMAVLRHDVLGMSLAARRGAARLLAALAFLTVGALLFGAARLLLPGATTELRATDLGLVAAAIILSQGFRTVLDWVALRVYGVPRPADAAGRHETYRLAAAQAVHDDSADARTRLARLRGELGIDAASAAVLEQIAHETSNGPLIEGQRFAGRYRVGPMLGRGGMARAFLAHDERLDRPVVLKEIHPGVHLEEGVALREARLAGAVQHPNVLIVHDAIERKDRSVLVTEHAAGGSLAQRLAKGPPLPAADALRILRELLEGLAAVHEKGIVHRDLKPENVLLAGDGRVKIADFGIARARPGQTRAAGGILGTPEFMAPEQRRGDVTTPATDVYAAGLLGRRLLGEAASPAVAMVLQRALREEPAERWSTARAMLDALGRAAPSQDQ